jgi:hypothetical protein
MMIRSISEKAKEMDEAMGIEFTKRDVKPTQSIRDQLDAATSLYFDITPDVCAN